MQVFTLSQFLAFLLSYNNKYTLKMNKHKVSFHSTTIPICGKNGGAK